MENNRYLNGLINAAVHAHNNPKPCNMFNKPCDLLTCHTGNRCLWTKEESQRARESARNWNPAPFPPVKPNRIARPNGN